MRTLIGRWVVVTAAVLTVAAGGEQSRLRRRGVGIAPAAPPVCDQTVAAGTSAASIASTVSSAPNNTIVCLDTATYGTVNLFNIHRTGFVTLRSTSGVGANISPRPGDSWFIRFQSLTLHDVTVNSCSLSIEFVGNTWVANSAGLLFDASSCPTTTHSYLVDGDTFANVGQALYEGRLNCRDCNGAIVRNSTFSGVGTDPSDGIQTQGNTKNFDIGPKNIFDGILDGLCGATHCDAVQLQGGGATHIYNNLFKNGSTYIMAPDGSDSVTVEDNVFDGSADTTNYKIQFGAAVSPIFRHNTLFNTGAAFDSKVADPATTNALVENNIADRGNGTSTSADFKTSGGSGCTTCTFRYNQFSNVGDQSGTNVVAGAPTYTGGSTPATWAGWQLTVGSIGHNAGNDGVDLGTRYYGT